MRCCGCGGADTCDAVDPSSNAAATIEPSSSGNFSDTADAGRAGSDAPAPGPSPSSSGSDAPGMASTWAYIDALPTSVKDAMKACNKGKAPQYFTSAIIKKLPQDDAKDLWPELLCQPAEVAVAYIKQQNPKLDVVVYKVGMATIGDIEDDRVNVWLNKDGIVRVIPDRG